MDCIEPISDGRDDAKRIMQLSDNAAGSLSRLLDYLAGRKADNRAEAVWHVLRQLITSWTQTGATGPPTNCSHCMKSPRRDALTLESALSALRWIGVAAKQKQRLIAARNKTLELQINTLLFACLAKRGSRSPANCLTQRKSEG